MARRMSIITGDRAIDMCGFYTVQIFDAYEYMGAHITPMKQGCISQYHLAKYFFICYAFSCQWKNL